MPAVSSLTNVISGNTTKGPLNGATIHAYAIDARGLRVGGVVAETVTDAAGNWSMSLPAGSGNLIIESSGGVYVDEADPEPNPNQRRTIQLGDADTFAAFLPDGTATVSINIFTDAMLRKSRHETQGENFFEVHALNRSFFQTAFGFDLTTTRPADPIQPDTNAPLASRSYAMALGGAANLVNTLAIANQLAQPDYMIISALIEDMTDCTIDGIGVAGPIPDVTLIEASVNFEILRFRNNNFSAYANTPLLQIDQSECARSAQLPDRLAPAFPDFPADFVVESPDGLGIPATTASVQAILQSVVAIDDRDGVVAASNDLPAVLPIGATPVSYTATDQAGNTQTATVIITVAPPLAPTIVAPPDVVARSWGEITQVNLGEPQVSDNVTIGPRLMVANDAPSAGFENGQFTVTWTVSDEIGLMAEATQQVYVGIEPGYNEMGTGNDLGLLPVLPDPDEFPIDIIPGSSIPNTGATFVADSDLDGLPDMLEAQVGSSPYSSDTDGDGVPDPLELQVMSDPTTPSQVVRVPVTDSSTRSLSFTDTGSRTPAFILLAPGLHIGSLTLASPCDHVVLLADVNTVISGTAGPAITIDGCNDVRVLRLSISESQHGAMHIIDSDVTITASRFTGNVAEYGGVINLTRSSLHLAQSVFRNNHVAGEGVIRMDAVSRLDIVDSET